MGQMAGSSRAGAEVGDSEPRFTRRHMLGVAAAVGASTWVAPQILSSSTAWAAPPTTNGNCQGVKITQGAINGGKVALCNDFETDNKVDLSCFVTDITGSTDVQNGFLFRLCGPTATNLSGVAAKIAGNGNCSAPFSSAGCTELDPNSGETVFASGSSYQAGAISCVPSDTGFLIRLGTVGGPVMDNFGNVFTAPAGCRLLFIDDTPNVNEIGLAICFPIGSLPPSC